ncbi:MAG: hypothetical protein AAF518_21695 [Spirochaetota bacterium]
MTMITYRQARKIVEDYLDTIFLNSENMTPDEKAVVFGGESSGDYWLFDATTPDYIKKGKPHEAILGVGVFGISKIDGSFKKSNYYD